MVGGLFVYVLVMHSFHMTDLAEIRGAAVDRITNQAREAVAMTIDAWREEATASQQRLDRVLARAEQLSWALSTPDVERDVQLKRELEVLKSREPS